MTTVSSKYLNL